MTKKEYRRITVKANKEHSRRGRRKAVKWLKVAKNYLTGVSVELTRMTAKSGKIIYAVMVRRIYDGRRYRIWKYETIGTAWNRYKACKAA